MSFFAQPETVNLDHRKQQLTADLNKIRNLIFKYLIDVKNQIKRVSRILSNRYTNFTSRKITGITNELEILLIPS